MFGRGWLVLCLAAIILIGNHPPTAVMAAVLLGLYVFARIGLDAWQFAPLPSLLLAAGVIALGSVYFLVPFALEQSWTGESALSQPLISLAWPQSGALLNYVVWDRAGIGPVYTAYVGLSIIACALAGAPLALRTPRDPVARLWLIAVALGVVSLFLAGIYVRPSGFTFFFLCIAAAAGVQLLLQRFPGRAWIATLIFVVFVIDVAPSALQPFTRTDARGVEDAGKLLAKRAANERVLQVSPSSDYLISVGPNSTPLNYARVQVLHGPHKPDATRAHNGIVATLDLVADDLAATNRLGPQSRLLLGMLNVGWVVGVDGLHMGLPPRFPDTIADPVLGPYWRLPEATPVLASGHFELAVRPAAFDAAPFWNGGFTQPEGRDAKAAVLALTNRMGVDLAHRQAAAILLSASPPWPVADRRRAGDRACFLCRRTWPRETDRHSRPGRPAAPGPPDLSDGHCVTERRARCRRRRRIFIHRVADRGRAERHRGHSVAEPAAARLPRGHRRNCGRAFGDAWVPAGALSWGGMIPDDAVLAATPTS